MREHLQEQCLFCNRRSILKRHFAKEAVLQDSSVLFSGKTLSEKRVFISFDVMRVYANFSRLFILIARFLMSFSTSH